MEIYSAVVVWNVWH